MRNGKCVKCEAEKVYLMNGNYADTVDVPLGSWATAATQYYVCASCGYLEIYVKKSSDLAEIAKRLEKVPLNRHELKK